MLPTSRGKGKKNSLAVGPLGSASPCLCLDKGRAGGSGGGDPSRETTFLVSSD